MSKDLPINLDNTNDIYRRQASLGGNKITRSIDNTEGNTTLVWGRVTQVYYQKGTCDFKIQGQSNIFVDNSGSDGTLSAPIPVDYYGKNYDGHPFIKTRLIQKGNKVLVAFVNGSTANPVIIGVYPDNSESYELLSPALDNKISDNTEDTNYRVNNEIEINPANQMIYKSGDGSWAKSMQGRSFLIVQGNKNFELEKVSSCYENIPYFYKDNASDEPVNYPTPVYSENTKAPEWLLVHEGNWELDGSSDKHRTRFYVNQEGELQIVFFTLDKPEELLVVDGNKDTGFTIMKQFDSDTPMDKNSKNYVKFNVGDNNEISMSVSPSTDSKEQAQSLEIKSDGIYVNGKLLTSLIGDNQGSSDINVDDVKDIINSTTGIEDWDKFKDTVHKAAQDAQQAADEAKKAGDAADAAGQDAAQAGLDAKLAGENAAQKVSDLKDKMLYYLSLSPEKDLYVPGKYLILNEDVTIKNGFIKEGYIDDAAINSASIKDAAITSAKIKDLAVYSAKIANAAITNAKIADLSVGTAKIRDLAVTDEKVGKLTFNHMIGETLDANLINVTNLTADSIKAHSITADKITIGNLGELSPNLGNITGGSIDAGNVNIDNLPADDPNILTPDKKAKLRNTVDTLQEAVKAQNDFQNSVGAPSDTCNTLNMNMSKLIADTTPLLRDMHSNSEYDHKLIDNDIDNVNIELNNLSHKAITTIGKTADGKNTIYTGAFAPSNPHIGDIWAKPSDDGSNEGTFEIYGENGWFSPTKDVYNRVQSQINNLPKSYYQGNEPTGDIATGSIWYKTKQDAMGNISFDMYVYQDGKWVAYNDSAIEGLNAKINQVAQTADGKNSIYSSSTAPANPKANDIWIDTGHNNAIKVYINGQWISPDSNQEQINQQITDAFQNVPSVYYQSTQPTGNIVEGSTWYKTGDNNTYTMYTYKNGQWVGLLDDNINTAVQGIDFGGRNLLLQSQARDNGAYYMINGTKQNETFLGANVYEQHGTWQGQEFKLQNLVDRNVINTNDEYVFSTYVKYTGKNPGNMIYFFNADNTIQILNGENGQTAFANTKPNVWNQISIHIKFNSTTPPSSGKFYAGFEYGSNNDGSVTTYWACPKLEKGSKATDYSVAPEDIDSSLLDNKNASVQISQSYNGVTIDDKDGITINACNNRISLNANVGIDIYGNRQHSMKLDTNGNLIMHGNLVAGNISGVNIGGVTFKGNDMNLTNVLNVNGAIKSNGVTIDSNGLHVTKGDITLGDTNGTVYTQLTNKGTLIAKSATISGTVTSNNVNITGGSINLVKPDGNVAFHVDSTGNAVFSGNLSGVNIMGNNSTLSGMLSVNGTISAASGNVIMNNDGLTINKGSINIGNGQGTTFKVNSDGTLFSNSANITGQLTAKKILIANDADDIVMNANGNFILNKDGSVYANNLSIKNGTIDGSTVRGSSIIGSSLKLSDTYNNLFYSEPLSRAQYDSYGLRTGSTTKGQRITNYSAINHVQGIREHRNISLVNSLYKIGWYITSDGSFVSDTYNNNIASDKISILQGLPINISISDGPSNIFTRGGDRIICFYDSNNNFISGISTTTNQIKVTPPQSASYLSISIAVGGGAKQWIQATSPGNLTIDTNNSVTLWQGDCSEGYSIVDYGYNEDLNSSNVNLINSNSSTQYFSLDTSHLMEGDRILLELDINYDSYKSFLGSCFYLTVNNKNEMDSESYFGSDNIQYAMQGNYKYTWVLEYHQSLGNTIVVNLNMKNQYYGTRWFITNSNEIISPINNLNDYSYYGDKINTLGVMSILNSDGDIRQSKISEQVDINSGSSLTKLRDIQQHQGYMMLQAQNSQYDIDNGALNVLYNDTSKVYLSGSGMAFIGDFNKNYVEQYMYPGHYTTSIDGKWAGGSAITFWGNISCDSFEEEDFSYALGTGLVIDNWGNFHLMFNSTSWNLNNSMGVLMLQLDQTNNNILMGNMYGANVPGRSPADFGNGVYHTFNFEGYNGHLTLGRLWMSTFGFEHQSNSDVDFHVINDNGWFRFFSGIASSDGTFHTISSKEDKYDIALLDTHKSINAIQNTDFARFHYKNQHDRAESYQKGIIIDNSNDYSVDNSFVDDNGKTLNIMNLVATLADVVKEQQKQISELNAKVAYLEINK